MGCPLLFPPPTPPSPLSGGVIIAQPFARGSIKEGSSPGRNSRVLAGRSRLKASSELFPPFFSSVKIRLGPTLCELSASPFTPPNPGGCLVMQQLLLLSTSPPFLWCFGSKTTFSLPSNVRSHVLPVCLLSVTYLTTDPRIARFFGEGPFSAYPTSIPSGPQVPFSIAVHVTLFTLAVALYVRCL